MNKVLVTDVTMFFII